MKRAARLLLLLLTGFLLALPVLRVQQQVRVLVRAPIAAAFERKATTAVEHAVAESSAPRVAAASLQARLPAPQPRWLSALVEREPSVLSAPRDLRQALRRVQIRRRLPRLSDGDPPWC